MKPKLQKDTKGLELTDWANPNLFKLIIKVIGKTLKSVTYMLI